jgi:hypothetical protein
MINKDGDEEERWLKHLEIVWKHVWQSTMYKKITQVYIINDLLLYKYTVFKLGEKR